MALPDFLLIGAPKCGTTALHVALAQHPHLFISRLKEPKFFLTDGAPPKWRGPGDASAGARCVWRRWEYEALFAGAPPGALRGESTTLYLADRAAHRRIARLVPRTKLIAVLRDPIDRAHSNWTHLRSAGLEPVDDFLVACNREPERVAVGWGPFWRYLGLGRYGKQLEHLYSLFPRDQVLVLLYRQLREQPGVTLDRVTSFLGVEPGLVTRIPSANVTAQVSSSLVNRAVAAVVRHALHAADELPPPLDRGLTRAADRLARVLQREQRVRIPLTSDQRAAR